MGDPNENRFMKSAGIKVGGWMNAGVTYNAGSPDNNFNGPVTFGDRANEFQLNQINLFVQRAVATEGDSFDFGGRFDVMYGSDAIFTQAYGVPAYDVNTGLAIPRSNWDLNLLRSGSRFYDIALPQAYAEAYIPIGNGLNVKAGHFYTPIGYETVPAPDNFFYTHAYTMQYGEPFTHTGALFTYPVNKNISVTGGVVSGWDSFFQEPANFLGSVSYTTDNEKTSVALAYIGGDQSDWQGQNDDHRSMYSIVVNHDITDSLHYTLQHDYGVQENWDPANGSSANWYGINQYLTYAVNDQVSTGIRFEWFRDEDGARVFGIGRSNSFVAQDNHYFALTAGVNYSPLSWLMLRPEIRYDWVDQGNAFDDGSEDDQVLISADAIIRF
jgi:hypothetical protein